ncbi:MAG: hypothetical protein KKC21_05300 [Nitrospinae bacterium]|nr:hypothetical protein [Nitrospinota bacterium]
MIGGLLSISIAFGCGLVLMSFSEMNLLPPEVMARVGWSIIAFSILGYCLKTLFEKSKKLQETTFKIKGSSRLSVGKMMNFMGYNVLLNKEKRAFKRGKKSV